MAKAAWITPNPSSGTGTKTVSVSASTFTGRKSRATSLTITSTKDTTKKATVTCTQSPIAEDLKLTNDSGAIAAAGTSIKYEFETNSKYFCLKMGSGYVSSNTITVQSVVGGTATTLTGTAKDGWTLYTPANDPGATETYTIRLSITVPVNETITAVTRVLTAAGNSSDSAPSTFPTKLNITCTSVQAAKVVTLTVSPTSITIPAAGTAQTITVTSNDAWSIS